MPISEPLTLGINPLTYDSCHLQKATSLKHTACCKKLTINFRVTTQVPKPPTVANVLHDAICASRLDLGFRVEGLGFRV